MCGLDNSYYYKLGKSFYIEGFNCSKSYNNGYIRISGLTRKNQDVLYDLIKNDIIIKVDAPLRASPIKLEELQKRIQELENQMKKWKGEKPESWK